MKISRKIISIFMTGMIIVALFSVANSVAVRFVMNSGEETVKEEITASITESTEDQLRELAGTIGSYELSFEAEIDRNMLTAANLLYEKDVDSGFTLTDSDLERLLTLTGMSDMYISDADGVFTETTEEAGKGLSLFDIWEGYRMLVTGESDYLPSSMKIKEETGEIFKFTAIPRQDRRGTLQSALQAETIQEDLQQFITESNGIRYMYFIDLYNTVLTENLGDGISSVYHKGSIIDDSHVADILNGSNDTYIEYNGNMANVYAPVTENGSLKYVIIMNVDLTGYYAAADMIDEPFYDMISSVSTTTTVLAVIVVAIAVMALIVANVVLARIFKPLKDVGAMAADMSEGRINTPDIITRDDNEISDMAASLNSMKKELSGYITDISDVLEKMSKGDFRKTKTDFKGDFAEIGSSLNAISGAMTNMINNISLSSEQVTDGAAAISDSSRNIADNAARQVQEVGMLEEKIKDISENIGNNASDAADALRCSEEATGKLGEQNVAMTEMMEAMHEIERHSGEIGSVIKTIEDIAFQTNILALNASVEAAHAGEAGKGFAVVADEVRNLAAKSSEAAGNTSKLITATVESVKSGVSTADSVAAAMNQVMELSAQTNSAIRNISEATDSQNAAVHEIRGSIENISSVIQTNSDAAGDSAARSSELREQADVLREQISGFTV